MQVLGSDYLACQAWLAYFLCCVLPQRLALQQRQLAQLHSNLRGEAWNQHFIWFYQPPILIAFAGWLAEDVGLQGIGVDSPEFTDAVRGVERGLAACVIAQTGIGNFDAEQGVGGLQISQFGYAGNKHKVRLDKTCGIEPECSFWN